MENVKLIVAHGANGAEEVEDGEEVAGSVEEEAMVGEKRAIRDRDPAGKRLWGAPRQLGEGLETAHGTLGGGGCEMGRGAGGGDGEGVGLVRGGGVGDGEGEGGQLQGGGGEVHGGREEGAVVGLGGEDAEGGGERDGDGDRPGGGNMNLDYIKDRELGGEVGHWHRGSWGGGATRSGARGES